jgi:hypothetical protein
LRSCMEIESDFISLSQVSSSSSLRVLWESLEFNFLAFNVVLNPWCCFYFYVDSYVQIHVLMLLLFIWVFLRKMDLILNSWIWCCCKFKCVNMHFNYFGSVALMILHK